MTPIRGKILMIQRRRTVGQLLNLSLLISFLLAAFPNSGFAQNTSSSGSSWSSGWGFASASDRNVALSRSQAVRQAKTENAPTTVVNNVTDNRSNYVENITDEGSINSSMQNGDVIDHLGDQIGNNTNSVGSMNTGSTNLTVEGDNNHLVANNTSDNTGCIDGSVHRADMNLPGIDAVTVYDEDDLARSYGNVTTQSQSCE